MTCSPAIKGRVGDSQDFALIGASQFAFYIKTLSKIVTRQVCNVLFKLLVMILALVYEYNASRFRNCSRPHKPYRRSRRRSTVYGRNRESPGIRSLCRTYCIRCPSAGCCADLEIRKTVYGRPFSSVQNGFVCRRQCPRVAA